jgi:WG containing repeat
MNIGAWTAERGKVGGLETESYGYINTQGQWVVPPQLVFANNFQEGLALVSIDSDTGFTDIHGQKLVASDRENGGEMIGGCFDGYYLDTSGQIAIAPSICNSGKYAGYEVTGKGSFSEGLASAHVSGDNRGIGFIDKSGELVIEPHDFWDVGEFTEGIVRVQLEYSDKFGYMDCTGKIIVEPQFCFGWNFSGGLATVGVSVKVKSAGFRKYESQVKRTYVNTQGKLITPPQFDRCEDFAEERGIVKIDHDYGCLDTSGRCIVEPQFLFMGQYSHGLSHTALDSQQWGFIDLDGNMAIPFKFEDATPFREGLAAVRLNNKWGFINRLGEFVIEPIYDAMNTYPSWAYNILISSSEKIDQGLYQSYTRNVGFFNGVARVVRDNMYFFIDVNNKLLTSQGFDDAYGFDNGYSLVKSDHDPDWQVGFIDKSGKVDYFPFPREYAGLPTHYNWYEPVPFCHEDRSPFRNGLLKLSSRTRVVD